MEREQTHQRCTPGLRVACKSWGSKTFPRVYWEARLCGRPIVKNEYQFNSTTTAINTQLRGSRFHQQVLKRAGYRKSLGEQASPGRGIEKHITIQVKGIYLGKDIWSPHVRRLPVRMNGKCKPGLWKAPGLIMKSVSLGVI